MHNSLTILCEALKQIVAQLKPKTQALSFLILTGRSNQGKSTLMRQSNFDEYPIDAEGAHIYFNQFGVIVELSETWLNESKQKPEYTLKQLNQVHRHLKISGILLCVDINELLIAKHDELKNLLKANAKLLECFGLGLNYCIDVAIVITKMDLLAGFCDFYQAEHPSELAKPLGFSIYNADQPTKISDTFKTQFDKLIEQLGQKVTDKIHSIRSNIKRTLIREFPLQVASLRNLILPLISSISGRQFRLQALYFTSGEQGGIILDRLNKKIQYEFSLAVQDQIQQSTHYRSYFIEGALFAFQTEAIHKKTTTPLKEKRLIISCSTLSFLGLAGMIYHYFNTAHILNKVQDELIIAQQLKENHQTAESIYHLNQAGINLNTVSTRSQQLSMIKSLHSQLNVNTQTEIMDRFIPIVLHDIEQAVQESTQTELARYQALKVYLMLGNPNQAQIDTILAWYKEYWQTNPTNASSKKLTLLKRVLSDKNHPIVINPNIVADARNYLNALPLDYLYYSLAKTEFDQDLTPIKVQGFQLSNSSVPIYLTQKGFQNAIAKLLIISHQFIKDNWVLERHDLKNLPQVLQTAYCEDYLNWWQHFLHNTQPLRAENYAQVGQLTDALLIENSFVQLLKMIQTNTRPRSGSQSKLFNQYIASQFSDLNLLNKADLQSLATLLKELKTFSRTLSLISDRRKTAFALTKGRFQGDKLSNPIGKLYTQAQHYPQPLSKWTEQIADDLWFNLITDTREYLNYQWKQVVYSNYVKQISHHYPIDSNPTQDVALADFNHFFAPDGLLEKFSIEYIKPFLDTSQPQWRRKELNHTIMPISKKLINELMRANVITHMFFPHQQEQSFIEFSLQKINLDPTIKQLQFNLGNIELIDNQNTDSFSKFNWPQDNAKLVLRSIEGKNYQISETGHWAIFKLLQKANILVDEQDSSNLQIIFEINGYSGRYLLKTQNQVNPFIPGILSGFNLQDHIA